jgi:hypothetical protein
MKEGSIARDKRKMSDGVNKIVLYIPNKNNALP